MKYVFDTSALHVMDHYYPAAFSSFWVSFDTLVQQGIVLSTREVKQELARHNNRPNTQNWVQRNGAIFQTPCPAELAFVAQILRTSPFQALIGQKQLLTGAPVADPFVIAAAKILEAKVVTQETFVPNAAKIPTACQHFDIPCTNLEGFIMEQGWTF